MKKLKKLVAILLIMLIVIGFAVGVVLVEYEIKRHDNSDVKVYQTEEEFVSNSQKYGYTMTPNLFNGEIKESDFFSKTFYKRNEIVRVENVAQYHFATDKGLAYVSVEITTNPDKTMLAKLAKNQWMNGIKTRLKAHKEEYKIIKTEVSNKLCSGIVYADGIDSQREYCMSCLCYYSQDCSVKISLSYATGGKPYDEDVLYNECLKQVAKILENII
ncbi:MAG: hypothetical protein IJD50_04470 [Clostridia bacterium]|nr:hypothetical protein [Clostridia bacterium]